MSLSLSLCVVIVSVIVIVIVIVIVHCEKAPVSVIADPALQLLGVVSPESTLCIILEYMNNLFTLKAKHMDSDDEENRNYEKEPGCR